MYDSTSNKFSIDVQIPDDAELNIRAMYEILSDDEGNTHRGGDGVYTAPGDETFRKHIENDDMGESTATTRHKMKGFDHPGQHFEENVNLRIENDDDFDKAVEVMSQNMTEYVTNQLQLF